MPEHNARQQALRAELEALFQESASGWDWQFGTLRGTVMACKEPIPGRHAMIRWTIDPPDSEWFVQYGEQTSRFAQARDAVAWLDNKLHADLRSLLECLYAQDPLGGAYKAGQRACANEIEDFMERERAKGPSPLELAEARIAAVRAYVENKQRTMPGDAPGPGPWANHTGWEAWAAGARFTSREILALLEA